MRTEEEIRAMFKTTAYAIGYKAWQGGLQEVDNPFKDEYDRACWELGWDDAEYDYGNKN